MASPQPDPPPLASFILSPSPPLPLYPPRSPLHLPPRSHLSRRRRSPFQRRLGCCAPALPSLFDHTKGQNKGRSRSDHAEQLSSIIEGAHHAPHCLCGREHLLRPLERGTGCGGRGPCGHHYIHPPSSLFKYPRSSSWDDQNPRYQDNRSACKALYILFCSFGGGAGLRG